MSPLAVCFLILYSHEFRAKYLDFKLYDHFYCQIIFYFMSTSNVWKMLDSEFRRTIL